MAHAGGRPPAFESPEELQSQIDLYFKSLQYIDPELGIPMMRPATITGLALALGFCSRQSMYDYEKKEKFTYTIKNARLRVENSYEEHLFTKSATGAIFGLKNMGWSDKQEIESKVEMTGNPVISFGDTSKRED
jgi:hypothetical protein